MRKNLVHSVLFVVAMGVCTPLALGQTTINGVTIQGGPPGTVAITGDDLSGKRATLRINDMQFNLESIFSTNRFFKGKNDTFSYTGGNWDFNYSLTYTSGDIKDDRIAITGTAQHMKPLGPGNLFGYTNAISAVGSPAEGTMKTSTVGPTNVLHIPDGFDQYTTILNGVVHNPWLGGREFNPWTFTINAVHFMGQPPAAPAVQAAAGPFNEALGINNFGQIVGQFQTGVLPNISYHGFEVNKNDFLAGRINFTTINFPGASSTLARGINDSSQIVGQYLTGDIAHGYELSGGAFTTIDFPGAADTTLFGINNVGQIVGVYTDAGRTEHGFLFSSGIFTAIDFPGAISSKALSINNLGQIVGQYNDGTTFHSFLLSGGSFTTIDPPGAASSGASGINDLGQIVGIYFDVVLNIHGYELSGGTFTTVDFPGADATGVRGIDNAGQLVGIYADNTTGSEHGLLFHQGNLFTVDVVLRPCDVNGDGKIDINDINAILAARNIPTNVPSDPYDPDGDGIITVNDSRICVNRCTNALCAPVAQGCLASCSGGSSAPACLNKSVGDGCNRFPGDAEVCRVFDGGCCSCQR